MKNYDYIIIGAGIIGMAIAKRIRECDAAASVLIVEKEEDVARHASGRNSGVLHAGFYYTKDSLKARFCVEGNAAMKDFCWAHKCAINDCGKLVVAQNEEELAQLRELLARGLANGANVKLISADDAQWLEPNVNTFQMALHSPDTASVDPKEVCEALRKHLLDNGVELKLNCAYRSREGNVLKTTQGDFEAEVIINCAGLYADKIAHDFGFGLDYTIMPFKGLYLKYTKNSAALRMHIYPVPNLKNPFLGVHFTKMADETIKIGPTAIPALWRENYGGIHKLNLAEMAEIGGLEAKLYATNAFGFRDLANEEMKKYNRKHFIALACRMVKGIDPDGFGDFTNPGIRAQLLDRRANKLLNDFVIEADEHSVHVLNAVSPAFTCAFPFAAYVAQKYLDLNV
jgi:L-2-hydroxyglutarate oxidase LhgO